MKCILALLLLIAAIPCLADDGFVVNTVTYNGIPNIGLALDTDSNPVIATLATTSQGSVIRLIRYDSNGYQNEDAAAVSLSASEISRFICSFDINDSGDYGIAFVDTTGLKFAYKTAWLDWQTTTVDQTAIGALAMCFSPTGVPHLAYTTQGQVMYATYNIKTNSWEKVPAAGQMGMVNSIAISTFGDIAIAFTKQDSGMRVVHKTPDSSGWKLSPYFPNSKSGSVAFTSTGHPVLTYINDGKLKYALSYADWYAVIVDDGNQGTITGSTSLALDINDKPGISYIRGNDLMFASPQGGWHSTAIDAGAGTDKSRLIFNGTQPIIAYYSNNTDIEGKSAKIAGTDIEPTCLADLDNSGAVDLNDFASFASQWLSTDQDSIANIDGESPVNTHDLLIFTHYWLWER